MEVGVDPLGEANIVTARDAVGLDGAFELVVGLGVAAELDELLSMTGIGLRLGACLGLGIGAGAGLAVGGRFVGIGAGILAARSELGARGGVKLLGIETGKLSLAAARGDGDEFKDLALASSLLSAAEEELLDK